VTRDPSLTPDQWERAVACFEGALGVSAEARDDWLEEAAKDPDVRSAVRSMLRADARTNHLLESDLGELAALAVAETALVATGQRIDDFEIGEELDRGGMGILYRAKDVRLDREVALKFFLRPAESDAERRRQLAEARTVAALDHPNIGAFHRVGETTDGSLYMAMPLYTGENLRERLGRGRMSRRAALDVARQVAQGLGAAHAAGIVHRDVKPENVFLTTDGVAKLLDFGIAADLTDAPEFSSSSGTTAYLSPEQVRGAPPDPRMDVWALGLTLYEMLVGAIPYEGDGRTTKMARIAATTAPPLLPARLRHTRLGRVLRRALSPDPERRYADGASFERALAATRRSGWLVGSATAALAGAAAWLALTGVFGEAPEPQAAPSAPDRPLLVVLPLEHRTADTTDAWLAIALADEIALRLVRTGDLTVRVPHEPPAGDAVAFARSAGAAYLVDGSLERRDGGGLRVRARLIRSADHETLWQADYPVNPERLIEMERDIAGHVARSIGVPLARPGMIVRPAPTSDGEAYEHYLRGNYYLAIRTPSAVARAMEEYGLAEEADSTFLTARVRRAYGAALFADWGWRYPGRTTEQLLADAMEQTDAVFAADSLQPEAWLTRAYVTALRNPNALDASIDDFRRSLALDPYNAEAHHQYGQTLMALGRYEEAVSAYRNAIQLEPDRAMSIMPIGVIREVQGRPEDAMVWLDSAVAMAPQVPYVWTVRAMVRLRAGDLSGALSDAERSLYLDDSFPTPTLSAQAMALARLGRDTEAASVLDEAIASLSDPERPTATEMVFLGEALVAMDRPELFLDLLERVEPRGGNLWFYLDKPGFDAVRDERVFRRIAGEAWPDASRAPPERAASSVRPASRR
jgi:serine/threonine-protein kinase